MDKLAPQRGRRLIVALSMVHLVSISSQHDEFNKEDKGIHTHYLLHAHDIDACSPGKSYNRDLQCRNIMHHFIHRHLVPDEV